MKSPEGSGPLRIKTPQQELKENTKTLSTEAAKAEREIHDAEKDILRYEEGIAHSNAVIDSLTDKMSGVEDKEDQTEYNEIKKHQIIEMEHVRGLIEQKEARVSELMSLHDEKTTLEKGAEHFKNKERQTLH